MKDKTMIEPIHLHSKRIAVTFHNIGDETPRFTINRVAQALLWLVHKGKAGVTALEVSSWALRLADYVHSLRHDYGLYIETQRELHDGGWHARYVLHTELEITNIINTTPATTL